MYEETFQSFKWMFESRAVLENGRLALYAPAKTNYFSSSDAGPIPGAVPVRAFNAPFFYTDVTGDFVLSVKVSHEFRDVFDAAIVMVMQDENVWAKSCFEKTDFDTHAVVSVVTNGFSDDANGCNIDGKSVWLKVVRARNSFCFLYSLDGKQYFMMRTFGLPVGDTIKVGLVAQAPVGNGGERYFEHFSLEHRTVTNLRFGE